MRKHGMKCNFFFVQLPYEGDETLNARTSFKVVTGVDPKNLMIHRSTILGGHGPIRFRYYWASIHQKAVQQGYVVDSQIIRGNARNIQKIL